MQIGCTLNELCQYFELVPQNAIQADQTIVSELISDSRAVKPGSVFFAWKGGAVDSHQYIASAVKQGAIAVVGTENLNQTLSVPYFQVADSRYMLAGFAAYLNGFPAKHLIVIGVTGTDGKTTTTNYIYHILQAAGIKAGMISTVNAVIGNETIDTGFHVTTPEAPQVQQYLARMVAAGVTHVVLEATSHGLAQHRVAFCDFDYAVVTNITHEHLDYHGSYEGYLASKAKLFEYLLDEKNKSATLQALAVLNMDDKSYPHLVEITAGISQIKYGLLSTADLWADEIINGTDGIDFIVHVEQAVYPFHTHLQGEFNVLNCLAAIGVSHSGLGIPMETIQSGINRVAGLIGRMNEINMGQSFKAFVDFAHTPYGLQAALKSARKLTEGSLIAVFGSAGLRDKLKRRMMAQVAAELADITLLTAEDPRTESLDGILQEMSQAMLEKGKQEGKDYFIVRDRGKAIRRAVHMARADDLVIACGKGHEQSMCFGETEYAWDETTAMKAALSELLHIPGPEMPYLPTQDNQ